MIHSGGLPAEHRVSGTWLPAAVLGGLWAAVEIILGSVLHNLRIPLAGTLLAGLGVVLMTAGHRLWPEPGLLWRTGLVCALMKSISPSAIIIGPMIGIMAEALLLETGIRLAGRTLAGYMIGGALAVTESLFQKIVSILLTYGTGIVNLYVNTYKFAAMTLGIAGTHPIDLIVLLAATDLVIGVGAAALGFRVAARSRLVRSEREVVFGSEWTGRREDSHGRFSLLLLGLHCVILVSVLVALSDSSRVWSLPVTAAYLGFVILRYGKSLRILKRPGLWIELAGVTLLSGFLLGGLRTGAWDMGGVMIGIDMCVRAILVVSAFSAIGIELRNPTIVSLFMSHGLMEVSASLDLAFATLPSIMSFLRTRDIVGSPVQAMAAALHAADVHVRNLRGRRTTVLLTGERGSGKTTAAKRLVDLLRASGKTVAGILAHGHWDEGVRSGFDVEDIRTGERRQLCRRDGPRHWMSMGPFRFDPDGLALGHAALTMVPGELPDCVVVDEVGPLELDGRGWAEDLDVLLRDTRGLIVLVVRTDLCPDVQRRWGTPEAQIVSTPVSDGALRRILSSHHSERLHNNSHPATTLS